MALFIQTETDWRGLELADASRPEPSQRERIMAALGATGGRLPRVDEETLFRYYQYLSANMSLPFAAYYPEPHTSQEKVQYRCAVLELLDPRKHVGDEFDGIFCKTRKGKYEINLPLIELQVPDDCPQFPLIEDYWFWFWNWRGR